jgi:hypothetical protein
MKQKTTSTILSSNYQIFMEFKMRVLFLLFIFCCLSAESNITYIDLRTEHFVVGVSPSVGGRIYKLIADDQNISVWNERLLYHWNREEHYGYHLYGGNEIWLSPQSQWQKKWPPNMSMTTLPWDILDQSPTGISMQSQPQSDDVWQLKRDIKIINQNSFSNTVTLTNISKIEQAAGIWFMNRAPRDTKIHLPADIKGKDDVSTALMKDAVLNDKAWKMIDYNDYRQGKLYYHSDSNYCSITRNGVRWHIAIAFNPDGAVHSEQADYEIARDPKLVEFEYHGPCIAVEPQLSISATETWTLTILNEN